MKGKISHRDQNHACYMFISIGVRFKWPIQKPVVNVWKLVLFFLCFKGCEKGQRIGYKCYLVYNSLEDYAGASRKCIERGGRMAMPRDRKEQEALADYVKNFFHPGNWPVWLGVNDLRSEGLYLFDDGTRVTYFQWRKHFLSSQPDGGRRENCVAMSSDDGDWWDHYCDRTMNYMCEFDDRVAL